MSRFFTASIKKVYEISLTRRLLIFAGCSGVAFVLSILTIPTSWGLRFHFFQYAIFLAGSILGPVYGGFVGLVGGLGPAFLRNDPYILLYNILLGAATGLFAYRFRPFFASLLAFFLVHLPVMLIIGIYVQNVPVVIMTTISLILAVEDFICAAGADATAKGITRWLKK